VYTFTKLHDRRIPNVGVGVRVGPVEFQLKQAVTLQVTKPFAQRYRLPLHSAVTFPAKERHRPPAGTKLYWLQNGDRGKCV